MSRDSVEWFRNYSVHYRDEPTRIMAIEETISTIMNVQNVTRSMAMKRIFHAGLEQVQEGPTIGDPRLVKLTNKAKFYELASLEAARKNEFIHAYRELGPKGIQAIADRLGIEVPEELADYAPAMFQATASQFEQTKLFILDFLKDGEPHRIEDVREAAIKARILPDPKAEPEAYKRDYTTFKTAACELGVSGGRRGYWQKTDVTSELLKKLDEDHL